MDTFARSTDPIVHPIELGRMPRVWRGTRRRWLVLLVAAGLVQAAGAGAGAHTLMRAMGRGSKNAPLQLVLVLAAVALLLGAAHFASRVLTEKLSQDYVHEIRIALLTRNLQQGRVRNLGVAVARTTNDLTSVRNWVSMGVAPLLVAVPFIVCILALLASVAPWYGLAATAPVLLLLGALACLSPATYERSRQLRRSRGRLAGHVADAITSMPAIKSAGGAGREINRLDQLGRRLIDDAVSRAYFAGALRGASAAATGLVSASVIGVTAITALPSAKLAAAMSLVAFLASPLHDLGRATEYRQTYRAARRIISPAVAPVATSEIAEPAARQKAGSSDGRVRVGKVTLSDGRELAGFVAEPGDRVVFDLGEPDLETRLMGAFSGMLRPDPGWIVADGRDLAIIDDRTRRHIVGYAAQAMSLSRGSVARNVLYRNPKASRESLPPLLAQVGLVERVSKLPRGVDTVLRHGGEPLTVRERAGISLARALLDTPSVLVLEHIDSDLGRQALPMLRDTLTHYPGVVLITTDVPAALIGATHVWSRTGLRAAPPRPEPMPSSGSVAATATATAGCLPQQTVGG